jgi:hypothetical protein
MFFLLPMALFVRDSKAEDAKPSVQTPGEADCDSYLQEYDKNKKQLNEMKNSDGLHSFSDRIDARPLKVQPFPPTITNVLYDTKDSAVKLSWAAGKDPTNQIVDTLKGYIIERKSMPENQRVSAHRETERGQQSGANEFLQITGIINDTETAFIDYGAFQGNTYVYRVSAIDANGNLSDPSIIKTISIP